MKKTLLISVLITSLYILPENLPAESVLLDNKDIYLLDEIQCIVCGPASNAPIANTDFTWKRTLENKFVDLSRLIEAEIINQQVVSEKMPLDPEAIIKYIDNVKKQLNLNDAELEQLFADFGKTMQEGLDMFQRQYISEFFAYYKFKSQMVANDEEIEKFFNENPEFIDGIIEFKVARLTYDDANRIELKKTINQYLKDKTVELPNISWGHTIKLAPEELSAEQQFLTEMTPGEIRVVETDGMFELYHMLINQPTEIKPLSQRRNQIIDRLNRKKLDTMVQDYNQSVKEFIDIIYFNDSLSGS